MTNNAMTDLETFGTKPGSVIRSVGAVTFDPFSDKMGSNKFYFNVDRQSCLDLGLTEDEATVKWWAKPTNARAQAALLVDPKPIVVVLVDYAQWFRKNGAVYFWSQGANFDEPLLSWAFQAAGMKPPWRFADARDTRTVYDVARFNSYGVKRTGTHHTALADAEHQVRCVQASYAKVNGRMV